MSQVTEESVSKPITFVSIWKRVASDENGSKNDLSIPIIFNAILQLANDKNLALYHSKSDEIDFVVSVDTTNKFLNGF